MGKLSGRTAIITGANQGLGKELAKEFVLEGANVCICARDYEKLVSIKNELENKSSKDQVVIAAKVDVSEPVEVTRFVENIFNELESVEILVNNAGIYGPKGEFESNDWDEWVDAIKVNLLGSAYFCRNIIPHFKKNRYGKIIQLSGGGATGPLPNISAYSASKAGIVRLIETLAHELVDYNIDANSIAPGALNTRLLDEILDSGPEKVGASFYERAVKQKQTGGAPLSTAVKLAVFLASSESDGITGKLISAVWDPWENLMGHKDELNSSDIYTLRRIVPKDRGLSWGSL